jgi:uncharacterized protein
MISFLVGCVLLVQAQGALEDEARLAKIRADAARGVPSAQLELAEEYLEGAHMPVDEVRALELVRASADAGYVKAQLELAEMYACGMGEPRHNGETPTQLYLKAANSGWGDAMQRLAFRYRFGLGTERDELEAARWLVRSMGKTSEGVGEFLDRQGQPLQTLAPEDRAFANFLALYLKAWKGDVKAAAELGHAFLKGEKGKPNYATACFWLTFASRAGNSAATAGAAETRAKLSAEQIVSLEKDLKTLEALLRARQQPRPE